MSIKGKITGILVLLVLSLPVVVFARDWTDPVLVPGINTGQRDLNPFLTADGKTMYFDSDRGSASSSPNEIDIFISHLVDGQWTVPERLPSPPNDPDYWDGNPTITLDGRYMYFFSNRPGGIPAGGGIQERTIDNYKDIWVSENIDGQWQEPVNMGPNINSDKCDSSPTVSSDGQNLIFHSSRPGGYGSYDLYISHKIDGVWQPAVNMGATVNSATLDHSPSLSYTGRYLFMARGGSGSFAYKSDIFYSPKIKEYFHLSRDVGHPPSSNYNEAPGSYNECTQSLYFHRSYGSLDIMSTQWLNPNPAHGNPCSQLIIPEGQWRIRVTLLEASAALSNDIYIDHPISKLLIKNSLKNVGKVVSSPFFAAEELIFHIGVDGTPMGLGRYDHYSNGQFAQVERTGPLRYIVGFEDLPAQQADWDFNDTVLLVELIGVEIDLRVTENFLGENQIIEEVNTVEETNLSLDLHNGVGMEAAITIPGGGLAESTYAILTEGQPELYDELLDNAPFESAEVFLKVELTSGQAQLLGTQKAQIMIAYLDEDDDGMVDGKALFEDELGIYRYDNSAQQWFKLDSQPEPELNMILGYTDHFSLFALGAEIPERLDFGGGNSDSDSYANHGLFGCRIGETVTGANGFGNMLLIFLFALAPVSAWKIFKKRYEVRGTEN